MTVAIFGLVGVLIGGLLNGAVTWVVEKARLRAASKVAARLLLFEIEGNVIGLELAIGESGNWTHLKQGVEAKEWIEHRETFAASLGDDDWKAVSIYYGVIVMFVEMGNMSDYGDPIEEETADNVRRVIPRAKTAEEALRRHLNIEGS